MPKLTLLALEPLTEGGLYARDFLDDLTDNHEGYTHKISAVIGFDTATFSIKGPSSYLREWFDEGLFRRILYLNPEANISWEGYVNRLNFSTGSLVRTKTIETLFNRVYFEFSPLDDSVVPPVALPNKVIIVNDLASQAAFGVKGTVVKGGEVTHEVAFNWASTVLNVNKSIKIGQNVNTSSSSQPLIKIDCLGYWHTLGWLPYENTQTGSVQSHVKIQDVLSYFNGINPGWISQDFGLMDYNFATVTRSHGELKTCKEIIEETIAQGGLGGERWVGGIYEDRIITYKPAEDFRQMYSEFFMIRQSLESKDNRFYEELTGNEIKPWDMRPDRILKIVDL